MSNCIDFQFINGVEPVTRSVGNGVNYKQMVLGAKEISHCVQLHGNDDESAALKYEEPKPRCESLNSDDGNCVQADEAKMSSFLNNIPEYFTDKQKDCLKHWFKNLSGDDSEDVSEDVVVQSWMEDYVRSETLFHLHVEENKGTGIGGLILDPQKRPIAAYSLFNYSSAFYGVLLGVNIGLELAIKLKLARISLLCPSDMVARFVGSITTREYCCCPDGSLVNVCLRCFKEHHYSSPGYGNDDKTYLLMVYTVGLLLDFRRGGGNVLDIGVVKESNRSAAYVAEHGNGKGEIKLREILESNELPSLLTQEADIQGAIMASTFGGNQVDDANKNQMVLGKKETPHHVQCGKQLIDNYPQSFISNIDLQKDLTDAVKEFVKSWFKIEDSVDDLDQVWIKETIKSRDMVLLHVSGYFKEDQKAGYGVMIRDVHLRPITAYSKDDEYPESAFYHELQGVNKGLELAMELKLGKVSMRCTSPEVSSFVRNYWMAHLTYCCGSASPIDVCLRCIQKRFYFLNGFDMCKDCDKAYLLLLDTLSLLQDFHRQGNDLVINAVDSDNKSAAYIAEHGNWLGKMKLSEILQDSKLLSLLFEEATIERKTCWFRIRNRMIKLGKR